MNGHRFMIDIFGRLLSGSCRRYQLIIFQLPIDCHKLVQWALTVTPSSAIRFLTTSQRDIADSSIDSSGYISYGTDFLG